MNNDKYIFVKINFVFIIERLIIFRLTIVECFEIIKKIDEIFVKQSILIHFELIWINNEFVDDILKYHFVFIDNLTIFDFENFEFIVYSIKNVKIFRFVYFFDDIINFLNHDFIYNIVIKNFLTQKRKMIRIWWFFRFKFRILRRYKSKFF